MSIRRFALQVLFFAVSTLAVDWPGPQTGNSVDQVAPAQERPAATATVVETEKAAATKPDYSKESFVTEYMRSRYRFENDGTGQRESVFRIRVQSEAGVQRWGQLSRPGALPAAPRYRRLAQSVWRLQRQAHASGVSAAS